MQEVEGALPVNGMDAPIPAKEPLDLTSIRDEQLGGIKVSDFGKLVSNPFVLTNTISHLTLHQYVLLLLLFVSLDVLHRTTRLSAPPCGHLLIHARAEAPLSMRHQT